jgi:hypothetical protein
MELIWLTWHDGDWVLTILQKVTSSGGRYRYKDDWETPDTQVITLEFDNKSAITWEGRSCNGTPVEGSSVGVIFLW